MLISHHSPGAGESGSVSVSTVVMTLVVSAGPWSSGRPDGAFVGNEAGVRGFGFRGVSVVGEEVGWDPAL